MKGSLGLAVAVALGVVGALCNWLYLHRQAAGFEKVDFVMISPDAQINLGDRLQESDFSQVAIPRQYADELSRVAIQWEYRSWRLGQRATRSYRGGELLLQQELSTPNQKNTAEMIGENEVTVEVPVDSRTFVSENYQPGDLVYFFAPHYLAVRPGCEVRPQPGRSRCQSGRPVSHPGHRQPQEFPGSRTGRPPFDHPRGCDHHRRRFQKRPTRPRIPDAARHAATHRQPGRAGRESFGS